MSHYTRNPRRHGDRFVKESTHKLVKCWGCPNQILASFHKMRVKKLCDDCKNNLTEEQIKAIYNKRYQSMREQKFHKYYNDKSNDRWIFNSPFRNKT